jgi:hypothetical protein
MMFGFSKFKQNFQVVLANSLQLPENGVLRGLFGPKGNEIVGSWSKLYAEELYNVYSSISIIRMNTSRRMRWVGLAARMG